MNEKSFLDYAGLEYYHEKVKELIDAAIPSLSIDTAFGTIVLWSGSEDKIPNGWHICDGTKGTPDLRNRFVLGAGDRYSVGEEGGSETSSIMIDSDEGGSLFNAGDEDIASEISIMPPYYALCYIMKLPPKKYSITLEEPEHGTATGGGDIFEGETCTLIASPDTDYIFDGWEENGEIVSTDNPYTFIVTKDCTFTAKFSLAKYIIGRDWEVGTFVNSTGAYDAIYENGLILVSLNGTNKIAYSADGFNWNMADLTKSAAWCQIAYGNGVYVLPGYNTSYSMYSYDGITWKETTLPKQSIWWGVVYGKERFVCPSSTSGDLMYSTDGIKWTLYTNIPSITAGCRRAIFANDMFVIIPNNGTTGLYSHDGIEWKTYTFPVSATWASICYGDGKFIVISTSQTGVYSEDGINWTEFKLPVSANWISCKYGGGKFIVLPMNAGYCCYSNNGIDWEYSESIPSGNYVALVWAGDKFITFNRSVANVALYSHTGNSSILSPASLLKTNIVETFKYG